MYQDKTLTCRLCGNLCSPLVSRSSTRRRGFQNRPTRCKACRIARKNRPRLTVRLQQREMYETTCAQCGAPFRVPFIPKNDHKTHLLQRCYASRRASRY